MKHREKMLGKKRIDYQWTVGQNPSKIGDGRYIKKSNKEWQFFIQIWWK